MTAAEFRNAILLLNCIDEDEFFCGNPERADARRTAVWTNFCRDPVKFYIHASDAHRNALFAIIQKRLTVGGKND